MTTFTAYKITNVINGKVYIGITRRRLADRWADHKEHAATSPKKLAAAMRKYGLSAFSIVAVAQARSAGDLFDLERLLIAQEKSFTHGYNMTVGGDGPRGLIHTAESRAKMSRSHIGQKQDPSVVARRAAAQRGRKMPPRSAALRAAHSAALRGRKWSAAMREKMTGRFKGRVFSEEWRAKISAAKKGILQSAEFKERRSKLMKGRKKPPRSPEHRAKIAVNSKAMWDRRRAAGLTGRLGAP